METNSGETQMLTIMQMCDSAFPTGGFSHSMGFESAHKHHNVTDMESFRRFILASLENTATKMVPFVREAHESADLMDAIIELDEHCQTCLTNHVENRASRRQGRALLDTSIETFIDVTMLRDLKVLVEDDRLLGHLPVVFGVVCASLQVGQKSTCLMFMYNSLRTMIASSVRLGFAGTLQAQGIQHEIQQLIPEIVDRHRSISVGEVHVSFPSVDVLQNLHDTMFSKLFYS